MTDAAPGGLTVSVQRRGTANPRRHLAAGILLDASTVLVPELPDELLDGETGFEVAVIPLPLSVDGLIERHRVTRLDVLRPDASHDFPQGGLLRLALPSQHPVGLSGFGGCDFRDALIAAHGRIWDALETLHLVPDGYRHGPSREVLMRLADFERIQAMPHRREFVVSPIDLHGWVCYISPWCEPCGGDAHP